MQLWTSLSRLATVLGILIASAAGASDGVQEINTACVSQGCFPGDAPGYPVTIDSPGAYRLTGNLGQTSFPPVANATDAIEITTDGVDLDLGGFTISCTKAISPNDPCAGSGSGVSLGNTPRNNVRIANGTIERMPEDGVRVGPTRNARIERITANENGERGINARSATNARIVDVIASSNGTIGVDAGQNAIVSHVVANDNGDQGIFLKRGSRVTDSVSEGNGGDGIGADAFLSVAERNTIMNNQGFGLNGEPGSQVAGRDNMLSNNAFGSFGVFTNNAGGNLTY